MTKREAIRIIRGYAEDEGPDSYEEAAVLFRAMYGRSPDSYDGDAGEVFSHACAALPGA
jgi:hypothetical protein